MHKMSYNIIHTLYLRIYCMYLYVCFDVSLTEWQVQLSYNEGRQQRGLFAQVFRKIELYV